MSKLSSFLMIVGLLGIAACSSDPGLLGQECVDSADCDAGLSCFNRPGGAITPVCMMDCDLATTRVCSDGSVCLMREGGGAGVCYLGGTTAVGAACDGALDCVAGSVCVNSGGATSCFRACVVGDGARCQAGETCSALMSGDGFCEP